MTPSQKLRSIADSTGLDGIADAIREIANEIEHNNAPAVPQGEPVDFDSIIEDVEAIDCRYRGDPSYDRDPYYIRERAANVVRRHASYYATPAPAPAQGEPFGYFRAEPFGWTDCSEDAEGAIALYEHPAKPAQEVGLTDEQKQAVRVMQWLDSGEWELVRSQPLSFLTDEANAESAWLVRRQAAPYCDKSGTRQWAAKTAFGAFTQAIAALRAKGGK